MNNQQDGAGTIQAAQPKDPFAGRFRYRLPVLEITTALHGGAPLREWLAGMYFSLFHNLNRPHSCMVGGISEADREAMVWEEWSYIPESEAAVFYRLADVALDSAVLWQEYGLEKPNQYRCALGIHGPVPAVELCSTSQSEREEMRATVERLKTEVSQGRRISTH